MDNASALRAAAPGRRRGAAWCAVAGGALALGAEAVGGAEAPEAAYAALFGSLFVLLAWLDIRTRLIPNAIVYPALLLAVGLSPTGPGPGLLASLGGGLGALSAGWAIRSMSRGGLGWGDVKMAALVGAVVGFPGIVAAGALTAAAGGLVAGALVMVRLRGRGDVLPYGPFVALGGLAGMLV